jgi:cellulose synthase/poly-beta-1,6-N-acetylglucosamine synthase-like glycosyltransferase
MIIQILTPIGYNHSAKFWLSLLRFQQYAYQQNIEIKFRYNSMSNIYFSRDKLLKSAIEDSDYDYVLWVDSDAVFEPKDIERLISLDLPVVGGMAKFLNKGNLTYNFGKYVIEGFEKIGVFMVNAQANQEMPEEPFEVDYTGCHFLLMKKGVAESIPFPRFGFIEWKELDKRLINANGYMSEDGAFCFNIQRAGYKVMIDPLTIIGHIKEITL